MNNNKLLEDLTSIRECIKRVYVPHDPHTEGLCLAIRGLTGIINRLEEKEIDEEAIRKFILEGKKVL